MEQLQWGEHGRTYTDPLGDGVTGMAFAPDSATLAVSDYTGNTYLWNTTTGKNTATYTDPNTGFEGVDAVAFAPDGTTLATGDDNSHTYLWNTTTGKITATLTRSQHRQRRCGRSSVRTRRHHPGHRRLQRQHQPVAYHWIAGGGRFSR